MVFLKTFIVLLLLNPFLLFSDYPLIKNLSENDLMFKQAISDITLSYVYNSSSSAKQVPLIVYSYQPEENENLFMISSRFNLPYEAISTLNRISSIFSFNNKKMVLVPNQPVIFVPETPLSDLEFLLASREFDQENTITIKTVDGKREQYHYIPDGRFNNTERAFFLDTFFRFPIERGRITSGYGLRKSPISGQHIFHSGIDIAAPEGTPVIAAGQGTVTANSYDQVLGNFIVVRHPGKYQTVYGHLKKSFVILGSSVNSGTIIGEVGSTGYSTGPHLHFEVRIGNQAEDPFVILDRKQ